MSVKNLNAKSPYALKSQKSGSVRARDAFVSHCKRVAGTEDRALWVVDTLEEGGLNVFFDRNDLDEISMDKLKEHVLSSAVIVTVLDPATYDSEWVRKEHEWAEAAGIPIVPFYDADLYKWADLSHWVSKYPAWFRTPAVEYHRAFHRNAKAKLVERVEFEPPSGDVAYAYMRIDGDDKPATKVRMGVGWPVAVGNSWSDPIWVVRILENEGVPYKFNFDLAKKEKFPRN